MGVISLGLLAEGGPVGQEVKQSSSVLLTKSTNDLLDVLFLKCSEGG